MKKTPTKKDVEHLPHSIVELPTDRKTSAVGALWPTAIATGIALFVAGMSFGMSEGKSLGKDIGWIEGTYDCVNTLGKARASDQTDTSEGFAI